MGSTDVKRIGEAMLQSQLLVCVLLCSEVGNELFGQWGLALRTQDLPITLLRSRGRSRSAGPPLYSDHLYELWFTKQEDIYINTTDFVFCPVFWNVCTIQLKTLIY